MNEMTLSSRHRIRNSSPGGLRPSTLPLGHGGSPQTGKGLTDSVLYCQTGKGLTVEARVLFQISLADLD